MQIEGINGRILRFSDVPCLDPITVILQDFEPGRGKIIIECFGEAWSAYWGGMGTVCIDDFILREDVHYLAKNLAGTMECEIADHEAITRGLRAKILRMRRDSELDAKQAREYFNEADQIESVDVLAYWSGAEVVLGEEWWRNIPTRTNPTYQHLCRIIETVKEGLASLRESQKEAA